MARSSAAVARASDSRCAATWPLALARRWRNAGGSGTVLGSVGELGDGAGEGAMQLGGVEVDADGIARAQCVAEGGKSRLDRRQARFELRRVGWREPRAPAISPCTLARSSWALAISLSAIASGLTLNEPSAIWAAMRATLSASNSAEAPPESSVDAVLDSATVALASTVAAAPRRGRRAAALRGLGRRGWRAGGRWPAAACQRDVRSSWGSPGGAGGAGTFIMDGLSARPATTLEISATTP